MGSTYVQDEGKLDIAALLDRFRCSRCAVLYGRSSLNTMFFVQGVVHFVCDRCAERLAVLAPRAHTCGVSRYARWASILFGRILAKPLFKRHAENMTNLSH